MKYIWHIITIEAMHDDGVPINVWHEATLLLAESMSADQTKRHIEQVAEARVLRRVRDWWPEGLPLTVKLGVSHDWCEPGEGGLPY